MKDHYTTIIIRDEQVEAMTKPVPEKNHGINIFSKLCTKMEVGNELLKSAAEEIDKDDAWENITITHTIGGDGTGFVEKVIIQFWKIGYLEV